jgi:5-methylcytosine-specific restriction protein A
MYKSCKYCGGIHDIKYECPSKSKKKRKKIDLDNEVRVRIRKFRDSTTWRNKRDEIQNRDLRLCQVCIREMYNTLNKYTYNNTSVHHIHGLITESGWDKRVDRDGLITLCSQHHSDADIGLISPEILFNFVKEQENR